MTEFRAGGGPSSLRSGLTDQYVPDLLGYRVTGADRYRHERMIRAGCRI